MNSPAIFRKWAAISTIAAALERKVWARLTGSILYPNMFVVLVGGPGVGKGQATTRARQLFSTLKDHHLGSVSLTPASMIDALDAAVRNIPRPGETPSTVKFNSLYLIIDELGVFLPNYDRDMMPRLTHLWDNQEYSEERRYQDEPIKIPDPGLNLLAGCTPDYLVTTMPEGAWNQGFMTRVMCVYCGEPQPLQDIFAESPLDDLSTRRLQNRLAEIGALYGPMDFAPKAAAAIKAWYFGGMKPEPEHPKLLYYKARRLVHLVKLCIVASVSARTTRVIEPEDYQLALSWLTDMEANVPDIFKAMTMGGDARVVEDAWYFAYSHFVTHKSPLAEVRLFQFLIERVPSHAVERIINLMLRSGMLAQVPGGYKAKDRHKL